MLRSRGRERTHADIATEFRLHGCHLGGDDGDLVGRLAREREARAVRSGMGTLGGRYWPEPAIGSGTHRDGGGYPTSPGLGGCRYGSAGSGGAMLFCSMPGSQMPGNSRGSDRQGGYSNHRLPDHANRRRSHGDPSSRRQDGFGFGVNGLGHEFVDYP